MERVIIKRAWLRDVVVILCAYEIVACVTRRTPTLTALQQQHRVVGPLLVGGLFVHFYLDDLKELCRRGNA